MYVCAAHYTSRVTPNFKNHNYNHLNLDSIPDQKNILKKSCVVFYCILMSKFSLHTLCIILSHPKKAEETKKYDMCIMQKKNEIIGERERERERERSREQVRSCVIKYREYRIHAHTLLHYYISIIAIIFHFEPH